MKTGLIGNGYWGSIVQQKLELLSDLKFIANSKTDLSSIIHDVDIVFICTPTPTHYDIVKFCLMNDKHIFCEKPFTGSYIKAKELFDLANTRKLNIAVDHVFLYRDEYNNLFNGNTIKFIWDKPEIIKQNIVDSLLYHDLYTLINFTECDQWEVKSKTISNEIIDITLISNEKNVEIKYNRNCSYKKKQIIINNNIIDFSVPTNDALYKIIDEVLNKNFNYGFNNNLCLKTLNLKQKIFDGIINYE